MKPDEQASQNAAAAGRTAGVVMLAGALIGVAQGALAPKHHHLKETSDVYTLPPPEQMLTLSLGYRSALTDVLWADVLVSQGLHTLEHRRYQNLTRLLDVINLLDPTFRQPYLMADALITFQATETPHDEVVKAREIMELGTKNRPLDAELWFTAGAFVSFLAPSSYLTDPAEQLAWRHDGAPMLARAAELAGSNSSFAWQALGGAGIYSRAGEREAAIRFLHRTLAVTDDDELKKKIQGQLDALLSEEEAEAFKLRQKRFTDLWHGDLSFVGKTRFLVLGPPPDAPYCAGPAHADEARCALTWAAWAERMAAEGPGGAASTR